MIDTLSSIMPTERFKIKDWPGMSTEFIKANKIEVNGLKSRGMWKIVLGYKGLKNSNFISGRFFCEIKNSGAAKSKTKVNTFAKIWRRA